MSTLDAQFSSEHFRSGYTMEVGGKYGDVFMRKQELSSKSRTGFDPGRFETAADSSTKWGDYKSTRDETGAWPRRKATQKTAIGGSTAPTGTSRMDRSWRDRSERESHLREKEERRQRAREQQAVGGRQKDDYFEKDWRSKAPKEKGSSPPRDFHFRAGGIVVDAAYDSGAHSGFDTGAVIGTPSKFAKSLERERQSEWLRQTNGDEVDDGGVVTVVHSHSQEAGAAAATAPIYGSSADLEPIVDATGIGVRLAATSAGTGAVVVATPLGVGGGVRLGHGQLVEVTDAGRAQTPAAMADGYVRSASNTWWYRDPKGNIQGPFSCKQMQIWFNSQYFPKTLPVKCEELNDFVELREWFFNHNPAFMVEIPEIWPISSEAVEMDLAQATVSSVSPEPYAELVNEDMADGISPARQSGAEVGGVFRSRIAHKTTTPTSSADEAEDDDEDADDLAAAIEVVHVTPEALGRMQVEAMGHGAAVTFGGDTSSFGYPSAPPSHATSHESSALFGAGMQRHAPIQARDDAHASGVRRQQQHYHQRHLSTSPVGPDPSRRLPATAAATAALTSVDDLHVGVTSVRRPTASRLEVQRASSDPYDFWASDDPYDMSKAAGFVSPSADKPSSDTFYTTDSSAQNIPLPPSDSAKHQPFESELLAETRVRAFSDPIAVTEYFDPMYVAQRTEATHSLSFDRAATDGIQRHRPPLPRPSSLDRIAYNAHPHEIEKATSSRRRKPPVPHKYGGVSVDLMAAGIGVSLTGMSPPVYEVPSTDLSSLSSADDKLDSSLSDPPSKPKSDVESKRPRRRRKPRLDATDAVSTKSAEMGTVPAFDDVMRLHLIETEAERTAQKEAARQKLVAEIREEEAAARRAAESIKHLGLGSADTAWLRSRMPQQTSVWGSASRPMQTAPVSAIRIGVDATRGIAVPTVVKTPKRRLRSTVTPQMHTPVTSGVSMTPAAKSSTKTKTKPKAKASSSAKKAPSKGKKTARKGKSKTRKSTRTLPKAVMTVDFSKWCVDEIKKVDRSLNANVIIDLLANCTSECQLKESVFDVFGGDKSSASSFLNGYMLYRRDCTHEAAAPRAARRKRKGRR